MLVAGAVANQYHFILQHSLVFIKLQGRSWAFDDVLRKIDVLIKHRTTFVVYVLVILMPLSEFLLLLLVRLHIFFHNLQRKLSQPCYDTWTQIYQKVIVMQVRFVACLATVENGRLINSRFYLVLCGKNKRYY